MFLCSRIILITTLALLISWPLKTPFPLFEDVRKAIPLPLLAGWLYVFISAKTRLRVKILSNSIVGKILAAFVLLIIISSIINLPSDRFKSLFTYLSGVSAFFIAYSILSASSDQKKLLKPLSLIIVIIAFLTSIYSLLVLAGGTEFINQSNIYIIDKINQYQLYDYQKGRIYLLSSLDLLIPFTAFAFITAKNKFNKRVLFIALFLNFFGLFLCNYRGKIVSGIIGAALIFFLTKTNKKVLAFALIIPLLISIFALPTNFLERLSLQKPEDRDTISGRIYASVKAIGIGRSNPFFGIGPGNFINYTDWVWASKDDNTAISYENPHNFYVLLFAEAGILPFVLYGSFLIYMIKKDIAIIRNQRKSLIAPFIISTWLFIVRSSVDWDPANFMVYFFLIEGITSAWYQRRKQLV